jgi:hypothetical protein
MMSGLRKVLMMLACYSGLVNPGERDDAQEHFLVFETAGI